MSKQVMNVDRRRFLIGAGTATAALVTASYTPSANAVTADHAYAFIDDMITDATNISVGSVSYVSAGWDDDHPICSGFFKKIAYSGSLAPSDADNGMLIDIDGTHAFARLLSASETPRLTMWKSSAGSWHLALTAAIGYQLGGVNSLRQKLANLVGGHTSKALHIPAGEYEFSQYVPISIPEDGLVITGDTINDTRLIFKGGDGLIFSGFGNRNLTLKRMTLDGCEDYNIFSATVGLKLVSCGTVLIENCTVKNFWGQQVTNGFPDPATAAVQLEIVDVQDFTWNGGLISASRFRPRDNFSTHNGGGDVVRVTYNTGITGNLTFLSTLLQRGMGAGIRLKNGGGAINSLKLDNVEVGVNDAGSVICDAAFSSGQLGSVTIINGHFENGLIPNDPTSTDKKVPNRIHVDINNATSVSIFDTLFVNALTQIKLHTISTNMMIDGCRLLNQTGAKNKAFTKGLWLDNIASGVGTIGANSFNLQIHTRKGGNASTIVNDWFKDHTPVLSPAPSIWGGTLASDKSQDHTVFHADTNVDADYWDNLTDVYPLVFTQYTPP